MSDPRPDDLSENGLDKGTGDPNDDRAYLNEMPPAQVQNDSGEKDTFETEEDDPDS